METTALKEFGLTNNECHVYLASLELGTSSATIIAKRASLPRPTTYDVLTSLTEKGLISSAISDNVMQFNAANPEKLSRILAERKSKIDDLLPQLLTLQNSAGERPNIKLFEGTEGLKNVIDDLIRTKQPITTLSSTKDLLERLTFFFPNYIKRRIDAKIPIKVITEKTSESKKWLKDGKKEFREVRFVSKEHIFPNAIFMYGNKLAFLNLNKDPVGIIIENSDLHRTFSIIFTLLWENAKPN